MSVHELKVAIAPDAVPALAELLAEHEEQRVMLLEDLPSGRAWLTGYFETPAAARAAWAEVAAGLGGVGNLGAPGVVELPDADWKESYKAHFKAWRFGPLHWVPVWERATWQLPAGEQVLWLDPGLAFGTGNHETTRLVVERLVAFAAAHGTAGRVLDAGCGSGILALSAVLLGFARVAGFDHDSEAVRVSEENAAMNGLTGRAEFFPGDLVSGLAGREAELVLANIQADVLMRFAPGLVGAVAPGGQLVLSGILGRELAEVRAAFHALAPDWRLASRELGEWSDLVLTRP